MKKNNNSKKNIVNTDKLYLVDLRFYNKNGVLIEDDDRISKAIVMENDGLFTNIISGEVLPYFIRIPYSSYTSDGIPFGTKLFTYNSDILENEGLCYVESYGEIIDKIRMQDSIELDDIRNRILHSDLYFKDRITIIEDLVNERGRRSRKLMKLARKDWDNNCYFRERLNEFCGNKVKIK